MNYQLRRECLHHPEKTEIRQFAYFTGKNRESRERFTEKMKRKIDTAIGRTIYGMRLAVGDPPFAHMIQIPIEALAFLIPGGTYTGWIAQKVLDVMFNTGVRGIKSITEPDVKKIQDHLFGVSSGGLAPSNGVNRWLSMDDPNVCFGETK